MNENHSGGDNFSHHPLKGHLHTETVAKQLRRKNSRKSVRWSAVPIAPMWVYVGVRWLEGQRPRRGQWPMLFLFEPQGWNYGLKAGIGALRLGVEPWSLDLSLEAGIMALGLELWLWGWNWGFEIWIWASRLGFEPQDWDLGLKVRIWISGLTARICY